MVLRMYFPLVIDIDTNFATPYALMLLYKEYKILVAISFSIKFTLIDGPWYYDNLEYYPLI